MEYPQTLLQIYDPPVLLYVRGDAQILNVPSLAVVGTRRPTLYGTQMTDRLAGELAARGIVIVSGLARGIDAIAHQGAVAVEGRAIGVLGTGIDVCYPKENKKLYENVLLRGAILSEVPPGTHPAPENFPVRKSHCSRHASRRHHRGRRAVFRLADYGPAGHGIWPRSVRRAGECHASRQLRAELAHQAGRQTSHHRGRRNRRAATPARAALTKPGQPGSEQRNMLVAASLTGSGQKIYALLSSDEPRPIDDIAENTGLNSSDVLATLFDLEMKGFVRQLPGKLFSKVPL
jgi:DNA processing protein